MESTNNNNNTVEIEISKKENEPFLLVMIQDRHFYSYAKQEINRITNEFNSVKQNIPYLSRKNEYLFALSVLTMFAFDDEHLVIHEKPYAEFVLRDDTKLSWLPFAPVYGDATNVASVVFNYFAELYNAWLLEHTEPLSLAWQNLDNRMGSIEKTENHLKWGKVVYVIESK